MHPRYRERSFGRGVGAVLMALAVYQAVRGRVPAGLWFGGGGLLLFVAGTFVPAFLAWPSRAWWALAHVLGWVNARVLLTAFFFVILTPVGIFMRLIGKNPFRAADDSRTTWLPYPARIDDRHHYERQF